MFTVPAGIVSVWVGGIFLKSQLDCLLNHQSLRKNTVKAAKPAEILQGLTNQKSSWNWKLRKEDCQSYYSTQPTTTLAIRTVKPLTNQLAVAKLLTGRSWDNFITKIQKEIMNCLHIMFERLWIIPHIYSISICLNRSNQYWRTKAHLPCLLFWLSEAQERIKMSWCTQITTTAKSPH